VPTYVIEYLYDDRDDRRDVLRPEHRSYLASLAACGRMPAYGRYDDDDAPGALLLAEADGEDEVRGMVNGDPFVRDGLVASYRIRRWSATWGKRPDS
jgi:uncharacterized protein YciI